MSEKDKSIPDLPIDSLKTTLPVSGVPPRDKPGALLSSDPFEKEKLRMRAWEIQRQSQAARKWKKTLKDEMKSSGSIDVSSTD